MNGLPSIAWHAIAAEQVAREVATDPRAGLSAAEAAARMARHGPNTISPRRGRACWVRLLLQFHAPLVYILLVAGAVTLWLAEYTDSAVILGVVLANAIIRSGPLMKTIGAVDARIFGLADTRLPSCLRGLTCSRPSRSRCSSPRRWARSPYAFANL